MDCAYLSSYYPSRGITVTFFPILAGKPRSLSPSSRYYREACPRPRGIPAVTAVLPQSPSPCHWQQQVRLVECEQQVNVNKRRK